MITSLEVTLLDAAGGKLHDILREEEAKAAARAAAQPATADVKTAAPGAARSGGWARVAASPTASGGMVKTICLLSTMLHMVSCL